LAKSKSLLRGLIVKQEDFMQRLLYLVENMKDMTDVAKKIKNTFQDSEAKMKTEQDHAEGKPSSETLNKAKVKTRDALT
jgi:DNA-binding phage protein